MSLWKKLSSAEAQESAPLRCSFCNLSQRDVRMLISGPKVYICDICVDICREILAENVKSLPPPDPGTVKCSLCRRWVQAEGVLGVGTIGQLCPFCSEAVRKALASVVDGVKQ
jgi:hypothetical protein